MKSRKTSCNDPSMGRLLAAYELQLLSPEEETAFERHLLFCDHCSAEYEGGSKVLAEVRKAEFPVVSEKWKLPVYRSFFAALTYAGKLLWRSAPVTLRLAAIIICLGIGLAPLAYFAGRSAIDTVQTVYLLPIRSGVTGNIRASSGRPALIVFVQRDATSGHQYHIVLKNIEGGVLYDDPIFDNFDNYGTGKLLLPEQDIVPGTYRLQIRQTAPKKDSVLAEYQFRITE